MAFCRSKKEKEKKGESSSLSGYDHFRVKKNFSPLLLHGNSVGSSHPESQARASAVIFLHEQGPADGEQGQHGAARLPGDLGAEAGEEAVLSRARAQPAEERPWLKVLPSCRARNSSDPEHREREGTGH